MLACFVFVLSQTYKVFYFFFCSIICKSCICGVKNVLCVLLKYFLVLQLCRQNRLVGPVLLFCVCVVITIWWLIFNCLHVLLSFVLSQTFGVFCLNVCLFCICVITNVWWVLFFYDCIFCLCPPHKRMVRSFYMLAYFAFLSSQTYLVFWSHVCMFCIFVVTKVWWVLIKCLDGLYLCRHKRRLFWLNGACFNLYFCRHKRIVCSVLPFLNALSLKFMLYMRNLCIVLSVDLLKNSSNLPFQYSLAIDKCHYENRQEHFCTSLGF